MPEPGTVRGTVSEFVLDQRKLIRPPVMEIGSHKHPSWWWADLRGQLGFDNVEWLGVDMRPGAGVDVVFDMTKSLFDWPTSSSGYPEEQFGSCVCAEVLEHVAYPAMFLGNVWRVLIPGAWLIVTTPFAFPVHDFPNDYWRFTPAGLRLLLSDAGFVEIETFERAVKDVVLYNHDTTPAARTLPQHVCAVAMRPVR